MNVDIREQRSAGVASPGKHVTMRQRSTAVNAASTLVHDVRLVLIAIWLGAAVFFSFAVAPAAFSVLSDKRELAGAVVNRTLGVVNISGFIVSLLLLGSSALLASARVNKRMLRLEVALLLVIALATSVNQWVIAKRIEALRLAMGRPLAEVAQSDPLRILFDSLHSRSVILLSCGMLAAVGALLLIRRRPPRSSDL